MTRTPALVLDVGGTTLRSALFDPARVGLRDARREPSHNHLDGATPEQAQARAVAQLLQLLQTRVAEQAARGQPVQAVGLAFAGPVDAAGRVLAAPTLWGAGGAPLALGEQLSQALGLPVRVLNDVSAAVWRYARPDSEPFCLVTVSSGVGNKVYWGGQILQHRLGDGGEIGHLQVDPSPDALRCDCGGRGHLGALASGRGALALAQRGPGGARAFPDAPALVRAAQAGSPAALAALQPGWDAMAQVLATLHAGIGVRRFLFMGGFAQALGPLYLQGLGDALRRRALFGVPPQDLPGLLSLAEPDDDHGLIGMGQYLCREGLA